MVREILRRRPCCAFPGCGRRRYLEIHHLRPFGRGGPTTLENLAPLCAFHHKLPHELGWGFRRAEGREVWTRPDGMPYEPGPVRPPDVADAHPAVRDRLGNAPLAPRTFRRAVAVPLRPVTSVAGVRALPIVAGQVIHPEVDEVARASGVWRVLDGSVRAPAA
jgi:hypothetical protein